MPSNGSITQNVCSKSSCDFPLSSARIAKSVCLEIIPLINFSAEISASSLISFGEEKTEKEKREEAVKHFKELESLIAIKNVNQDIGEPELDSSHRKTFGSSLKQAFSFFNK